MLHSAPCPPAPARRRRPSFVLRPGRRDHGPTSGGPAASGLKASDHRRSRSLRSAATVTGTRKRLDPPPAAMARLAREERRRGTRNAVNRLYPCEPCLPGAQPLPSPAERPLPAATGGGGGCARRTEQGRGHTVARIPGPWHPSGSLSLRGGPPRCPSSRERLSRGTSVPSRPRPKSPPMSPEHPLGHLHDGASDRPTRTAGDRTGPNPPGGPAGRIRPSARPERDRTRQVGRCARSCRGPTGERASHSGRGPPRQACPVGPAVRRRPGPRRRGGRPRTRRRGPGGGRGRPAPVQGRPGPCAPGRPDGGLLPAASGHETLRNEVARAHRVGHPFTLAFLDVDGLKALNDTHGHAAGDEFLRAVAAAIRLEAALLRPGRPRGRRRVRLRLHRHRDRGRPATRRRDAGRARADPPGPLVQRRRRRAPGPARRWTS